MEKARIRERRVRLSKHGRRDDRSVLRATLGARLALRGADEATRVARPFRIAE